jgi:hypothetical protein
MMRTMYVFYSNGTVFSTAQRVPAHGDGGASFEFSTKMEWPKFGRASRDDKSLRIGESSRVDWSLSLTLNMTPWTTS